MTPFQRLAKIDLEFSAGPLAIRTAKAITQEDGYRHLADVAERLLFARWLVQTGRLNDRNDNGC